MTIPLFVIMIPPGNRAYIKVETHVLLQTGSVEFVLSKSAANLSSLLKEHIDRGDTIILLHSINPKTLEHIVYYMEHYSNYPLPDPIEKPVKRDIKECISDWDYQFITERFLSASCLSSLDELISAANLLNCKSLMELACATTASIMRKLSIEEIRERFNIENDFTSEEYDGVMEESKWGEFEGRTARATAPCVDVTPS